LSGKPGSRYLSNVSTRRILPTIGMKNHIH
jgi:hypothetical protein